MTQIQEKKNLTGQSGSNPVRDQLIKCIESMINAMKADFGNKFRSQFKTDDDIRNYKNRLYQKLKGHDIKNIYASYDNYVDDINDWPPTVPSLLEYIKEAEKKQKREKQNSEKINLLTSLPATEKKVDPIKALEKAKQASESKEDSFEAWMERKEQARKNNDAVVNLYAYKRKIYASPLHLCGYPGCNKAGSLIRSNRGSEHWYCREHLI